MMWDTLAVRICGIQTLYRKVYGYKQLIDIDTLLWLLWSSIYWYCRLAGCSHKYNDASFQDLNREEYFLNKVAGRRGPPCGCGNICVMSGLWICTGLHIFLISAVWYFVFCLKGLTCILKFLVYNLSITLSYGQRSVKFHLMDIFKLYTNTFSCHSTSVSESSWQRKFSHWWQQEWWKELFLKMSS